MASAVQAAEAGKVGDPNRYRDFLIPPYANRFLTASAPYELLSMNGQTATVKFSAQPGDRVDIHVRARDLRVNGDVADLTVISRSDETAASFTLGRSGLVEMTGIRR